MPSFSSGVGGKVTVGTTDLNIRTWSAEEAETSAETTHSGSSGIQSSIHVDRVITGTVEADWDTDANPRLNPPNIITGTTVRIRAYIGTTGKTFDITTARVTGVSVSSDVKGKVSYSFTYTSSGAWVDPT